MIYDLYDLLVNLNNTTTISLIVQDGQIVISNFWSSLYNLKNLMNSENLVHSIYNTLKAQKFVKISDT